MNVNDLFSDLLRRAGDKENALRNTLQVESLGLHIVAKCPRYGSLILKNTKSLIA
jgi:hypothetical protein